MTTQISPAQILPAKRRSATHAPDRAITEQTAVGQINAGQAGPASAGPARKSRGNPVGHIVADEMRLTRLLATPGAVGRVDGERLVVFAPQRGVSLRIGAVPLAAAKRLESAGALVRSPRGTQVSLRLTEAGAARLRRQQAVPGEGFGAQHRSLSAAPSPEGDGSHVTLNEAESPLLRLRRRKGRGGAEIIGNAEFAAGERLRADLTLAQMMPRLTVDWGRGPGSGAGLNPTERMVTARQRADRALVAVGPEFSGLLIDICGFLKSIETVERERGWPVRSAKVVLALGLARLARHYGLSNMAVGTRGSQRQVWHGEGARPEFSVAPQGTEAASA